MKSKATIVFSVLLNITCMYNVANAQTGALERCKQYHDQTMTEAERTDTDEDSINKNLSICIFKRGKKRDNYRLIGKRDVEFTITDKRLRQTKMNQINCEDERFQLDPESDISFECDYSTSGEGHASCNLSCPEDFDRRKRFKLAFCKYSDTDFNIQNYSVENSNLSDRFSFEIRKSCEVASRDRDTNKYEDILFVVIRDKRHRPPRGRH